MNDFFFTVEEFIKAAKAKAADLEVKAANALRELAAWVEAQANHPTVGSAPPIDTTRLATCLSECQALVPATTKGMKGSPPPVAGPFAGILAKILAAILAALA